MNQEEMDKLIKKYDRKLKRLDTIIKQSDKQQLQLLKLHSTIEEQKKELQSLYDYTIDQQKIAKSKLESLIVNDYKKNTDIVFKASDVLSGDYYSIFKLKNDATLIYLLDGQGHGVSPALTIYAIASNILQILNKEDISFKHIISVLFSEIKKFLLDNEQISYTLVYIDKDFKSLEYVCGGMYPFYTKTFNNTQKNKANNLPFMSFSDIPNISKLEFENILENIIIYSDGLIEETDMDIKKYHPREIIKNLTVVEELNDIVKNNEFNDDVTFIHFSNPNK